MLLFLGFVTGNFGWQYFTEKDYEKAIDRSVFQGVALLLAWWLW